MVKEEVLCHLIKKTEDAKKELEKSLRQAKDYWHRQKLSFWRCLLAKKT